jgi:transposase
MDRQYVGIDFHRRRSVIVRMDGEGTRLGLHRIVNDPLELQAVMALCGEAPRVVIEATYGWYWAVDLLQDLGATVYLANPSGLNWGDRRVKNDVNDATDLADMLRMNRLPQAWIAPPALRELRELVRYRAKLVKLRSGLKAQVHAVMAKEGVLPKVTDIFGPAGCRQLDALELAAPYAHRVSSLRELIALYDREVVTLERQIHQHLKHDAGYKAIQAINGVGRVSAAVLVAEIGDVTRFPTPAHLCSWCGLTPKHRESDLKTRRGRISKQGSRLIRATLIEGISRYHGGAHLDRQYQQIVKRRGKHKARVALARKVLTLVYYGLRDGEIRCLAPMAEETAA